MTTTIHVRFISNVRLTRYVKSVFLVHVGGTRCVTSSTDHIIKVQARITLSVEFIRTCIFYIFILCVNTTTSTINTHTFNIIDFQVRLSSVRSVRQALVRQNICLYYTCWLYSLCNFQYRQQYKNTCSYNFDC